MTKTVKKVKKTTSKRSTKTSRNGTTLELCENLLRVQSDNINKISASVEKLNKRIIDYSLVCCVLLASFILFVAAILPSARVTKTGDSYPLQLDTNEFPNVTSDDLICLGLDKPNINLATYDGKGINLSEVTGKVVLQVVADWCEYCQEETRTYLDSIVSSNPDVTFVQYMETGGANEVNSFYGAVGKTINPNVVVVLRNDELSAWLENGGFSLYPTTLVFDDSDKVARSIIGLTETDAFNASLKSAFENPLYTLKNAKGETVLEVNKKVQIAQEYLSTLTEINIPKEYLN